VGSGNLQAKKTSSVRPALVGAYCWTAVMLCWLFDGILSQHNASVWSSLPSVQVWAARVANYSIRKSPGEASTSDDSSLLKGEAQDRRMEPAIISATAHNRRSELEGAAMPVADSIKSIKCCSTGFASGDGPLEGRNIPADIERIGRMTRLETPWRTLARRSSFWVNSVKVEMAWHSFHTGTRRDPIGFVALIYRSRWIIYGDCQYA
jgi:hypothetical protein